MAAAYETKDAGMLKVEWLQWGATFVAATPPLLLLRVLQYTYRPGHCMLSLCNREWSYKHRPGYITSIRDSVKLINSHSTLSQYVQELSRTTISHQMAV